MYKIPRIDNVRTGQRIKALCQQYGIKPKQLAETLMLGSDQTVYKWFEGRTIPGIDNLFALASLFHMRMDELIVVATDDTVVIEADELFSEGISLRTDIPEAAHYSTVENSIAQYLKDYLLSHTKALAMAIFADNHVLMACHGVGTGEGPNDQVLRIDFDDEEILKNEMYAALSVLGKCKAVENIMLLIWCMDDPDEFSEVTVRLEDGEWVFTDKYPGQDMCFNL